MTDERIKECNDIRNRLIVIRDEALVEGDFNAAVSLSYAIRDMSFTVAGEEWKEEPG